MSKNKSSEIRFKNTKYRYGNRRKYLLNLSYNAQLYKKYSVEKTLYEVSGTIREVYITTWEAINQRLWEKLNIKVYDHKIILLGVYRYTTYYWMGTDEVSTLLFVYLQMFSHITSQGKINILLYSVPELTFTASSL